jgi:hypothetical protein
MSAPPGVWLMATTMLPDVLLSNYPTGKGAMLGSALLSSLRPVTDTTFKA